MAKWALLFCLCRIIQVDLKFPPKPIVSSAAKDLISQVFFSTMLRTSSIQVVGSIQFLLQNKGLLVVMPCFCCLVNADACQGFFSPPTITQAFGASMDCSERGAIWRL